MSGKPSSFVSLLHAKKSQLDRRLNAISTDDAAEVKALVDYAASATNGIEDKQQATSEILYAFVVMYVGDKLEEVARRAEDRKQRDEDRAALASHARGCASLPRIKAIEDTLSAALDKQAKSTVLDKAAEIVSRVPKGKVKSVLDAALGVVALLYPVRYLAMAFVVSPYSIPLASLAVDAIRAAGAQ